MLPKSIKLFFEKAISFFRKKNNLGTKTWTDIWQSQHDHSFVVAGAMQKDLLESLREATDQAISDGTSLELFREQFNDIVEKSGWSYKGGFNWRTRVIFETNVNTSYQAGRYQQLQEVSKTRPYWLYKHNDHVLNPRKEHVAWDGLVIHKDDKWWKTHYPPNGWGCQCRVYSLSKRQAEKRGIDETPDIIWEDKTVGIRGDNPREVSVPKGIDPGWAYSVGEKSWKEQVNQ